MNIKDTEIKVVLGDITKLKVDAIVNAANNQLVIGGRTVAAIKKKGGGVGGTDETKIRDSCRNALRAAEKLKIKSIAFPALGCGGAGFPLKACAKIMSQEIFKHLRENKPRPCAQERGKSNLKEVIFCLYDKEAYDVFCNEVFSYLDYITTKLQRGPFVTVDVIIEINDGIVLIKRSNPPFGWALPGGFMDYGESLEEAVIREAKEETDLELINPRQFHTYSAPNRDPRFHTIATVFIAQAKGKPKAGDDAKSLKIVKLSEIKKLDFAFDHKKIILDYLQHKKGLSPS